MSSGIEEMEAELNVGGMQVQDFRYGITKISLWNFENFARIAKISQP